MCRWRGRLVGSERRFQPATGTSTDNRRRAPLVASYHSHCERLSGATRTTSRTLEIRRRAFTNGAPRKGQQQGSKSWSRTALPATAIPELVHELKAWKGRSEGGVCAESDRWRSGDA